MNGNPIKIEGGNINVIDSATAPTTTVPDVIGLTEQQASATIVAAGLTASPQINLKSPPDTVTARRRARRHRRTDGLTSANHGRCAASQPVVGPSRQTLERRKRDVKRKSLPNLACSQPKHQHTNQLNDCPV